MTDPSQKQTSEDGKSQANKTKVVRGLLTELLEGKWQSADRLTEAEACERFDVSRTPVREALFELQGLGLLQIRRNCGAVMQPFGPKELSNVYAVRTLLEVEATRLAASQVDRVEISEMIKKFSELLDSKDTKRYWENDQQLHYCLARTSGNLSLAAEVSRYSTLVQMMMEIIEEKSKIRIEKRGRDLLDIIEIVKSGKATEAANAMRKHLEQAHQKAASAMESFRTAMAKG
jgi:DNA-binding GntR family transcriptional regulator